MGKVSVLVTPPVAPRVLPLALREAPRWILHNTKKVPLNPRTQRPFNPKTGNYNNIPELWTTYSEVEHHKQIGFVLGGGFTGIDLDDVIVNGTLLPWAQKLIDHFNTFTEITVSGTGVHLWFRGTVTGAPLKKVLDHIEFYWGGRYFTVTGNHLPGTPTELRDDDSEKLQAFYQLLQSGNLVEHLEIVGRVRSAEIDGKVPVDCPWEDAHDKNTGVLETVLYVNSLGQTTGFHCLHRHCADKKLPDVHKWAGLKYARASGASRISSAGWLMARPGVIDLSKPQNYERALSNLHTTFRWNAFQMQAEVQFDHEEWTFFDNAHDGHLFYLVSQQFQTQPRRDVFDMVVQELAQREQHHPVKDYLNALVWDHTPRLDRWLIDFAGANDTPYVRAVSAITLIAGVRRVRHPGIKFDELLILESPQGTNKSSALRCMAVQDAWFSDDLPLGADSKIVIEATTGKWLIEAAELAGLNNRREAADIKSFLSRQIDGPARLAYAKQPVQRPREFVVVGSTNSSEYLQDVTGNRRFWPVPIKRFDLRALGDVRDQLWAEAAVKEANGDSIRLSPALWDAAGIEQAKREREDPWKEILLELTENKDFIQSLTVWHALHQQASQDPRQSVRLNTIMRQLGFVKRRVRIEDEKIFVWLRLDTPVELGQVPYPVQRRVTMSDFGYEIGDLG